MQTALLLSGRAARDLEDALGQVRQVWRDDAARLYVGRYHEPMIAVLIRYFRAAEDLDRALTEAESL